jgi:hypothetical protein
LDNENGKSKVKSQKSKGKSTGLHAVPAFNRVPERAEKPEIAHTAWAETLLPFDF